MKRMAAGAAAIAVLAVPAIAAWAMTPTVGSIDTAATASEVAVRLGVPNAGGTLAGCPVFPPQSPWNTKVADLPVAANSAAVIARIQADGSDNVHPDFGENRSYGIPFAVVPAGQPAVPVRITAYPGESDPGPFPVPDGAPIESGSDHHLLVLQQGTCKLHEFWRAGTDRNGWYAANAATFDLRSTALRPDGWTSADAAGLPILAGLARCDEVESGRIPHALRVTMDHTRNAYIHPATHAASSDGAADLPPMGLRLRLRADFDLGAFTGQARIILEAFRQYGLLVADNGSNWYVQGAPGDCWRDTELDQLKRVPGTAFEVVDTGPVVG